MAVEPEVGSRTPSRRPTSAVLAALLRAGLTSLRGETRALGRVPFAVSAAVAAGMSGTALVTWAVLARTTTTMDAETLRWFTAWDRPGLAHAVVRSLVMGGAFWLVGLVIGTVSLVVARRRRRPMIAVVCALTLIAMDAFIALIKLITGRTAPHTGVDQILVGGSSYPSGHTAHATVALVLLVVLFARPPRAGHRARVATWGWTAAAIGSAVVGLTTVILGYHWLTDVITGWSMAVVVLAPAVWVLRGGPIGVGRPEVGQPGVGPTGVGRPGRGDPSR